MGMKALDASRLFVTELSLEGLITGELVLDAREARLDELFPTAQLMPGACPTTAGGEWKQLQTRPRAAAFFP